MYQEKVTIKQYDAVYNQIVCDKSIAQEISEYFTFVVPGHQFMPAFKNRIWDGKFRIFNHTTKLLYVGLLGHLEKFCVDRGYEFDCEFDNVATEFSVKEAQDFIDNLGLPETKKVRDYQLDAFVHSIRQKRCILLSPTASGKSLIIYLIARYLNKKTLIIVPRTGLVGQLYGDFEEYGYESSKYVHQIEGGKSKDSNKPIFISTWQSIYKMPKKWFDQFEVIIGDEVHQFKAKSLTAIMNNSTKCYHRIGCTGTLDGIDINKLILIGLFGNVRSVATTQELIDKKHLAEFEIKATVLTYTEETKKTGSKLSYQDEITFLINNSKRNNFIKNLALSLDGNILVLFGRIDHGKLLYDLIKKSTNRPVYFIDGSVSSDERNNIRAIIEKEDNAILVASSGTTAVGTNIVKLHAAIFSHPSKSIVLNLQSIGRLLRKGDNKIKAILFDIADDMSWKSKKNHTLKHFMERVKIYNEQKFKYKIYTVGIKS